MLWILLALVGGCAHRTARAVSLGELTSYIQFPVVMTDEELAQLGDGEQADNDHLMTIQWRLERCTLKGWPCVTEVRVFRNRHSGPGHLDLAAIKAQLEAAGLATTAMSEKLDVHPGGGDSCYVVMRVLRQ